MRIGHGYDAHRFEKGKQLVLGGVKIESEYGLLAHSDGDVLIHALIDALFGAAGMRDIGYHFPDSDMKYKNADSAVLLEETMREIRAAGFDIEYADMTVIAQIPKLSPYIEEMRKRLAEVMGVSSMLINIKATTEEKMGFTGAKEGMAAHAVCLLSETKQL